MMKIIRFLCLSTLLTAATFAAERSAVIIRNVEVTRLQPPVYQSEDGEDTVQVKGMSPAPNDRDKWLRISVEFETTPEWIDRLKLEYYVLLPADGGSNLLFKGVADYIDVPAGRGHQIDMYLHPDTCKRYYNKGNVEYAAVALIDDKEVSVKTSKRNPDRWWKTQPLAGVLLNRQNTPFRIFSEDLCRAPESR